MPVNDFATFWFMKLVTKFREMKKLQVRYFELSASRIKSASRIAMMIFWDISVFWREILTLILIAYKAHFLVTPDEYFWNSNQSVYRNLDNDLKSKENVSKSSQSIDCGKLTEAFIFLINWEVLIQFLVQRLQNVSFTLQSSIGC